MGRNCVITIFLKENIIMVQILKSRTSHFVDIQLQTTTTCMNRSWCKLPFIWLLVSLFLSHYPPPSLPLSHTLTQSAYEAIQFQIFASSRQTKKILFIRILFCVLHWLSINHLQLAVPLFFLSIFMLIYLFLPLFDLLSLLRFFTFPAQFLSHHNRLFFFLLTSYVSLTIIVHIEFDNKKIDKKIAASVFWLLSITALSFMCQRTTQCIYFHHAENIASVSSIIPVTVYTLFTAV